MERQELGPLTYEVDGAVAHIVLDDPRRANSQTSEMVHAFDDALTLADRDYSVKVVVIRANGKGFCAGHATGGGYQYPEFAENLEEWDSVWKAQADLFLWPTLRLWEFRKPTIAQVHGYALGGGTYWALLPDITVASEDAYFQMPLVQGLGFPGGETMIEPWVFMNWKRTLEYLYTAQTLTADEARDMGLVNRVVPRAELDATVAELAAQIARAPLSTLMATKQLVTRAWELMGMRTHLQMSTDVMAVTARTKDAQALRSGDGGARAAAPAARGRRRRPLTARVQLGELAHRRHLRHLPLARRLHHLLHHLELLEQPVDVGGGDAAPVGDAHPPRAVDQRRVAPLRRRHRADDRLDAVDLAVVDLRVLDLLGHAREHRRARSAAGPCDAPGASGRGSPPA